MTTTIVTEAIHKVLDYARRRRACVLVQGRTGRGKTQAALAWSKLYRNTYYLDCPTDGGIPSLANAIMLASGAPSVAELPTWLAAKKATIIIDECARLVPANGRQAKTLEWLRRLHDTSGVALAFIATDFFMREVSAGSIGEYLEQLLGRFRDKLTIPDYVSDQEARDILSGFISAEPPAALIEWAAKIANERGKGGARRLWWLCEDAQQIALQTRNELNLDFLKAVLKDYEGKDRLPCAPSPR